MTMLIYGIVSILSSRFEGGVSFINGKTLQTILKAEHLYSMSSWHACTWWAYILSEHKNYISRTQIDHEMKKRMRAETDRDSYVS